ncbi:MAG TPA: SPFH domain-containing protein [Thermoanaerobaculia bacterium]
MQPPVSTRLRFQSPFLQSVRGRLGRLGGRGGLWAVALLGSLVLLRGCFLTYVPPDAIGMRIVSFGSSKGLQKEPVHPGYRLQIRGLEEVRTFPRDVQVVEFTNNPAESAEGHTRLSAIKVPTVDGYPVDVDVTVLYRIADPFLVVSKFGYGRAYEQTVVIALTDPLVKQFLGELLAEQFYGDARLAKIHALKQELGRRFAANGIALADVLIRQYDYPATFQSLTEQKKIQDQSVLTNRQLAKQAEVQTRLNKVMAEGQNLINVKTAEFQAQITEINAKKDFYERQKRAEADLLVKSADASGTELINRAVEGAGSDKLIRLRRGLALLNSIKGPIYVTEDPTDFTKIVH